MAGDGDLDDIQSCAVESPLAGNVDNEGRLDLGVLDHVVANPGDQPGIDEVAAGARVDGHGEAECCWGGACRRYRLSRGGWCDARKKKPTPGSGVDAAGAEPGGSVSSGLYGLLMAVGDEAVFAWPEFSSWA